MNRIWCAIPLLALTAVLASCSNEKGAATAAIQAAETSWTASRDAVMKILPAEAKEVDDAIASAKTSLEQGDAKAAMATAKELPAKIEALKAGLAAKETELRATWDSMSTVLSQAVADCQKHMDAMAKTKRLPAGVPQATVDEAKAALASATEMWTQAQSAQQSGDLADAVAKATDVKGLVVKALTALKMPVPAGLQSAS